MKYKEFITEMEKIGWHKTIFYGHVSSIHKVGFVHYTGNYTLWDNYLMYDQIRHVGFDKTLEKLKNKNKVITNE